MLEAVHLSNSYNGSAALKDLNLQIEPGEVFCLLGANGAGKTTTINLFLNFTQPTSGRAKSKAWTCGCRLSRHDGSHDYRRPDALPAPDSARHACRVFLLR